MRILAIESSGREFSLAALEGRPDEAMLMQTALSPVGERTAQGLAPRLDEMLREIDWPVESIGLIAVAVGPGSFTGLRIGVTTAKTLAYAIGAEVLGVNTLATIAHQAPAEATPLWVVMDAQREELFAAKFDAAPPGSADPTQILRQGDWLASLQSGEWCTGPGLRRLIGAVPEGVTVVDALHWNPTAAAVGQIAWHDFRAGRRDDLWKLLPQYYRRSAAEEKRERG